MSRYIDADALLEKAEQEQRFYRDEYDAMESGYMDEERALVEEAYRTMTDCVALINNAPTVDAVPVVRCKDCKWWWKVNGLCTHPKHCHDNVCVYECGKDYFCADGERKDGDE